MRRLPASLIEAFSNQIIMQSIIKTLKKKKVWIPLLLVILIAGYLIFKPKSQPQYSTAPVKRGPVVEEVLVTGAVKSDQQVDLSFQKIGRLQKLLVDVGTRVSQGQLLASLDTSVEYAAVQSAQGKLAEQQAHLSDMQTGARPEEISVKEAEISKDAQDLADAYSNVTTVLLDAYNKADNSVNRQMDSLFTDDQTSSPKLTLSITDNQLQIDTENGRGRATLDLAQLADLSNATSTDPATQEQSLSSAKDLLTDIQGFLNTTSMALQHPTNVNDPNLQSYKDNVNTARTNVTSALTNVRTQIQTIDDLKITLLQAQRELALEKLGSTPDAIAQQQAVVDQAQAGVLSAQAAYQQDFLYAPTSGTITAKNILPGELVSATSPALSLIGDQAFQIEADVPEADIAKISIGNKASTTLDAYGSDENFPATVILIDPAEKVIEGVPTYKVTLAFDTPDARIKSGMTVNVTIVTHRQENVLSVPQRAITLNDDGTKTVKVLKADGTTETRTVTTGLRGESGDTEITSGLQEGEKVVTFMQ